MNSWKRFDLKPGSYFLHHTSRDAAFEHILPDRELRLSPDAWMRDPLEAKEPWLNAGFFVPRSSTSIRPNTAACRARPRRRGRAANSDQST